MHVSFEFWSTEYSKSKICVKTASFKADTLCKRMEVAHKDFVKCLEQSKSSKL